MDTSYESCLHSYVDKFLIYSGQRKKCNSWEDWGRKTIKEISFIQEFMEKYSGAKSG